MPRPVVLCGCEGVKAKEHWGHCGSTDLVYLLPRSRFIREVVNKDGLLVGREVLPDLLLCGPCGREYKLMGYTVQLREGAELRVSIESGRLGLPAKVRQA